MKVNIPIIYLLLYEKMVVHIGKVDQEVCVDKPLEIIRRMTRQLPKKYDFSVFKELVDYGLFRKINNRRYIFYGKKNIKLLKKIDPFFAW